MPLYKKSLLKSKSRTQSSFIIPYQRSNSSTSNIPKEDYKNLHIPIKKRSIKSLVQATKSQELLKNDTKTFEGKLKKRALERTNSIHKVINTEPVEKAPTSSLNNSLSQCVISNIELNEKLNNSTQSMADNSLPETMKYSQSSNSSSIISPDLIDVCCSNLKLAKKQFQSGTRSKTSTPIESKVLKEISNTKKIDKIDSEVNLPSSSQVLHQNKMNVQTKNAPKKLPKSKLIEELKQYRIPKTKPKSDHRQENRLEKESNSNTAIMNKENVANSSKKHHHLNKKTEIKSKISMATHSKKEILNKKHKINSDHKSSLNTPNERGLKPKNKKKSVDEVRLVTKEENKPFNEYLNELDELQRYRNVGLYAFCDTCNKARFLPDCKDPLQLPDKWYCHMNPDPEYNSCNDPGVEISPEEEQSLIHNKYNAGSIVWAKCEGHPWWPAMVDDDPDLRCYYWLDDEESVVPTWYNVTFFDREPVTRSWIKTENLHSFKANVSTDLFQPSITNRHYHRIQYSKREAVRACAMSLPERLKNFGFVERYYRRKQNQPKTIKVLTVVEERQSTGKKQKISEKKRQGKRIKRNNTQTNDDLDLNLASDDISVYLEDNEKSILDNIDLYVF
ncbi:hypothetical protein GWI33_012675 [Rhynchophorus ferrugineus]|uniref:Zinc finger CW-type PWWP domain protein 1 n=1 Tax=Rhynchophorus ferrugineus TaxID=354439 RepID=A0A834IAW9_RHYFE|nr:hypothetical protein GWI33_012675 [Rhynchophorus ferrugineus]